MDLQITLWIFVTYKDVNIGKISEFGVSPPAIFSSRSQFLSSFCVRFTLIMTQQQVVSVIRRI